MSLCSRELERQKGERREPSSVLPLLHDPPSGIRLPVWSKQSRKRWNKIHTSSVLHLLSIVLCEGGRREGGREGGMYKGGSSATGGGSACGGPTNLAGILEELKIVPQPADTLASDGHCSLETRGGNCIMAFDSLEPASCRIGSLAGSVQQTLATGWWARAKGTCTAHDVSDSECGEVASVGGHRCGGHSHHMWQDQGSWLSGCAGLLLGACSHPQLLVS